MSFDELKALQEKHNQLVHDAQSILETREQAGESATKEDHKNFSKYMAEAKDLREQIDLIRANRDASRESQEWIDTVEPELVGRNAFAGTPVEDTSPKSFASIKDAAERDEIRKNAVNKVLRNWMAPYEPSIPRQQLTELERQAVQFTRQNYPNDTEIRAAQQSVGTSSAGGVLVASEWQRSVLTQMKAFGGMRRVARILQTGTGGTYYIPTSDDTGNVATIVAEATTGATTHVPFALVALEAAKYKSGPIKFSLEILQDSFIDLEAYVRERIAERFGRGTEAHFATRSSTEAAGPHGIINYSTGNVTVVGTTASPFTFDHLKSLFHKVDPAYRDRASVAWQFSDATLEAISKLKDSNGQYLWQPGLQGPNPNTLLGKPFVINQNIPSYVSGGTSAYPKFLWFGDWSHYVIRDVMPLSLFRMNERYLNEGNLAVIGFGRFDGRATFATTDTTLFPIQCAIQTT